MYQHWFFKSPIDKVGYWKIIPSHFGICVCFWSWEGGVAVRRSLRHGLWENLKQKESDLWFRQTRCCHHLCDAGFCQHHLMWKRAKGWGETHPLCVKECRKKGRSSFQRLCSHTGKMRLSVNVFLLWATGTQSSPGSFGKTCGSTSILSQWGMRTLKYLLTNFCHP